MSLIQVLQSKESSGPSQAPGPPRATRDYFIGPNPSSFGASNLLPDHLPSDSRIATLVKNVMTVDYAIGRAFDVPNYRSRVAEFARTSANAGLPGLDTAGPDAYWRHIEVLEASDDVRLAHLFTKAAGDSMETVNLFSPKQCNLACRGCYTSAIPVTRRPYDSELSNSYFDGAKSVIRQARELGARVVYTSGDGELTAYPRFFDLLDLVAEQNMQWLFFTAGLTFSSETAAHLAWQDIQRDASRRTVKRIGKSIEHHEMMGHPEPTVRAFLDQLVRYRDHIQVYHSVWSTTGNRNEELRKPLTGSFKYVKSRSQDVAFELPSSVYDMLERVFVGDHRERFGLEVPVRAGMTEEVVALAEFVHANQLKSYFEPVITTGRNRHDALEDASEEEQRVLSPLLVRKLCSFRNIHQPTIKVRERGGRFGFFTSPGMGIDLDDIARAGMLESTCISDDPDGLFAAIHSPLIVAANFGYVTGCKCSAFGKRLASARGSVDEEWQAEARTFSSSGLTRDTVLAALAG